MYFLNNPVGAERVVTPGVPVDDMCRGEISFRVRMLLTGSSMEELPAKKTVAASLRHVGTPRELLKRRRYRSGRGKLCGAFVVSVLCSACAEYQARRPARSRGQSRPAVDVW
jgi:hypothetical protein